MPTRRAALQSLAACTGLGWIGSACSFETGHAPAPGMCPSLTGQQIRWIVPNAAGGGYDAESRMLQPFLEQRLAASIVIDNRAGVGGIVGARTIADAAPDGRTIGILGVPGLLVATMLGEESAPNPARDFSILGRISRSIHVWAARASGARPTLGDMMSAAETRPLVFALNEVGSANFISINVSAALLNLPVELVPGFEGTRAACLAAVRGDVDMVCFNFETVRPLMVAGELRPVLQISTESIGDPLLEDVPMLGGPTGVAAMASKAAGRDSIQAAQIAASLAHVMGSGRLVVGPPALPAPLVDCLSGAISDTLASDSLRRVAQASLDPAPAAIARADAESAVADAQLLVPLIEPALRKLRS